ncbi:type VI secretion system baseplate protein IglJ [Fangia hongkongensis]|uniref:type VI secretion system baseplate protein IglJ n=1 Tax=Fangia hongkongensis TaxID=270495 RepID=UPI0003700214|nr:type VI secretion system baseplate protein IglJ [Fangia hongkongensis]MBK2125033.1 hypothetical protein [Fangia hongkongensis]
MQDTSKLSETISQLHTLNKRLNISELLHIIYEHGIEAKDVRFVPIFSMIPENELIKDIIITSSGVYIYIHLSKVPVFAKMLNLYHQANKNEQYRTIDIITKACSSYLHRYFYGLNLGCNSKYLNFYHHGNGLYGIHDTISHSAAILCTALQAKLADYTTFFHITKERICDKALDTYLSENSTLSFMHLSGKTPIDKSVVNITIVLENYNAHLIDMLTDRISNDPYLQKNTTYLSLKLAFISQENGITSYLNAAKVGQSTINGTRVLIL